MLKFSVLLLMALVSLQGAIVDGMYSAEAKPGTRRYAIEQYNMIAKAAESYAFMKNAEQEPKRSQQDKLTLRIILEAGQVSDGPQKCNADHLQRVNTMIASQPLGSEIFNFLFFSINRLLDVCMPELERGLQSMAATIPSQTLEKLQIMLDQVCPGQEYGLRNFVYKEDLVKNPEEALQRLSKYLKGREIPVDQAELYFRSLCSEVVEKMTPLVRSFELSAIDQVVFEPWGEIPYEWIVKVNVCRLAMDLAKSQLVSYVPRAASGGLRFNNGMDFLAGL